MSQRIFDKYEVVRRLAIGGMGEIFLSRQIGPAGFDRYVILKALLPDLAESEEAVARFLDEARLAATLNHPNIVNVLEVGQWEGTYFIVMEYIHGDNLGRIVRAANDASRRVPFDVSGRIIYDAALALQHAHERPMVHRDISRENIMVRLDGVTKVVDFGIAKTDDTSHRTKTGVLKGKLRYLPPEAFKTRQVDALGDQFSLGVVWWELLTGKRMFDADLDAAARIEGVGIEAPSDIVPDVPPELEDIVLQMLELNPEDRFESCGAMAERLGRFLQDRVGDRGLKAVGAFVREVAEARIEARLETPEATRESFLVPLARADEVEDAATATMAGSDGREAGSGTTDVRAAKRKRGARGWWAAAAIVLAVGAAIALWPKTTPPPVVQTAADSPPEKPSEAKPPVLSPAILVVTSTPSSATVIAGATVLGMTPLTTTVLSPNTRHALRIERAGFKTADLDVELRRGATERVGVLLVRRPGTSPPPPVAVPEPARISVKTKPWTRVSIDGRPVGSTPLFEVEVKAGRRRLRFVNEAKDVDQERVVRVKPGRVTKLDYDLNR